MGLTQAHNRRIVKRAIHAFDVLVVGFLGASIYAFIQTDWSAGVGFLGPALAALVGVIGLRYRKKRRSRDGVELE